MISASKRTVYVVAIALIIMMYVTQSVRADADFDVIRIRSDQVIEEGGGVNYIRIHRPGPTSYEDIFSARPKLNLSRGSVDENRLMSIREREGKIKEVREKFLEVLPELERSVGLRFWSTIIMWDEEPPALYVGLYRPMEVQLRAVAEAMENATKSHGVILRFYEALSPKDSENELREDARTLSRKAVESGQWDPEIPIPASFSDDVLGALEVVVNYTKTGKTYPDNEYVTKVIRAVRDVVGYRVPVIFAFPRVFKVELLVGSGSGYLGNWTSWLPVLIIVVSLSVVSYAAFRKTRKGLKTKSRHPIL